MAKLCERGEIEQMVRDEMIYREREAHAREWGDWNYWVRPFREARWCVAQEQDE